MGCECAERVGEEGDGQWMTWRRKKRERGGRAWDEAYKEEQGAISTTLTYAADAQKQGDQQEAQIIILSTEAVECIRPPWSTTRAALGFSSLISLASRLTRMLLDRGDHCECPQRTSQRTWRDEGF